MLFDDAYKLILVSSLTCIEGGLTEANIFLKDLRLNMIWHQMGLSDLYDAIMHIMF